jgi:AbrB family looped-hinge helix DNA binding protein
MAKVTSKLQVTVPKAVADHYGIRPGDELDWVPAGEVIRVIPPASTRRKALDVRERLRIFDESEKRQRQREAKRPRLRPATDRGWTREELYGDRGSPR